MAQCTKKFVFEDFFRKLSKVAVNEEPVHIYLRNKRKFFCALGSLKMQEKMSVKISSTDRASDSVQENTYS